MKRIQLNQFGTKVCFELSVEDEVGAMTLGSLTCPVNTNCVEFEFLVDESPGQYNGVEGMICNLLVQKGNQLFCSYKTLKAKT